MNLLPGEAGGIVEDATGLSLSLGQSTVLSFEQQRQLLLLQMEHDNRELLKFAWQYKPQKHAE